MFSDSKKGVLGTEGGDDKLSFSLLGLFDDVCMEVYYEQLTGANH